MEKTYILGNSDVLGELGFNFIKVENFDSEIKIHNWVVNLFKTKDIEKLVIEITDNPIASLQIGYHVRLSIEQLRNKVLTPILFISSQSLSQIMISSRGYNHILSTAGTHFCDFDLEMVKREIEYIEVIKESEYLTGFLKQINIQPDETVGRHSLANVWGAYSLDQVANTRALDDDLEFKKQLFFKYIIAQNRLNLLKNNLPSNSNVSSQFSQVKINARGKRVLLIDDEAHKGWEVVLGKVFDFSRPDDFVVINEKVKDYNSLSEKSKQIIENQSFDLYLIDLRLDGLDEDESTNTQEFSGMKILKKVKYINNGNQAIIFTASNKAWNLKSLLDAGADGYFLKESPEYNFTTELSLQNFLRFKEEAELCLRMSFLRDVNKKVLQLIENFRNVFPKDENIQNEIFTYTNIFFELIDKTRKDLKYYNYAYLQLFLLIELFISHESIFQDGEDAYVRFFDKDVIVQQKNGDKIIQAITFKDGKYQITRNTFSVKKEDQKVKRLDTNFKVSAILIFRFGNENSSVKKWTQIYTNRNSKTAHYSNNSGIALKNIIELLDFIEYLTTISNVSTVNIEKGLKEKSMEEAVELLKKSSSYFKLNKGKS